jgi:hypothetical protein
MQPEQSSDDSGIRAYLEMLGQLRTEGFLDDVKHSISISFISLRRSIWRIWG